MSRADEHAYALRVPRSLWDRLEHRVERSRRSRNAEIVTALEAHLASAERLEAQHYECRSTTRPKETPPDEHPDLEA